MNAFEITEHPADVKLRVRGSTKEDVFANAARGMMSILYGDAVLDRTPDRTEEIIVESRDLDSLLVDWLSELLYLSNTQYRAYIKTDIKKMTDTRIVAKVGSCKADAVDDIKAVTYHQLEISKKNGAWEASVVFDI